MKILNKVNTPLMKAKGPLEDANGPSAVNVLKIFGAPVLYQNIRNTPGENRHLATKKLLDIPFGVIHGGSSIVGYGVYLGIWNSSRATIQISGIGAIAGSILSTIQAIFFIVLGCKQYRFKNNFNHQVLSIFKTLLSDQHINNEKKLRVIRDQLPIVRNNHNILIKKYGPRLATDINTLFKKMNTDYNSSNQLPQSVINIYEKEIKGIASEILVQELSILQGIHSNEKSILRLRISSSESCDELEENIPTLLHYLQGIKGDNHNNTDSKLYHPRIKETLQYALDLFDDINIKSNQRIKYSIYNTLASLTTAIGMAMIATAVFATISNPVTLLALGFLVSGIGSLAATPATMYLRLTSKSQKHQYQWKHLIPEWLNIQKTIFGTTASEDTLAYRQTYVIPAHIQSGVDTSPTDEDWEDWTVIASQTHDFSKDQSAKLIENYEDTMSPPHEGGHWYTRSPVITDDYLNDQEAIDFLTDNTALFEELDNLPL